MNFIFPGKHDIESEVLKTVYRREEIFAEIRINRICFALFSFFLFMNFLLLIFTDLALGDLVLSSNMIGLLLFLLYTIVVSVFLKRKHYSPYLKYLTIFVAVTSISIVAGAYSFGNDFVHTARTAALNSYFLIIFLSGIYKKPYFSLYTSLVICLEYLFLVVLAHISGHPFHLGSETFNEDIITYDIVVLNIANYLISGTLMHLIAIRHRMLMRQLNDSTVKLSGERADRKRSEEKAAYLLKFDNLTQLPNYEHFQERVLGQLEKAASRKQIFAVMCLGLDSFKNINQIYGTETGSHILQDAGMRISSSFREDDFICRFMGDKFLILLTDLKSNYNISDIIRKSRETFEKPFEEKGRQIKLSACGGLCTYPNDGESVSDLIKKAETAMYRAKSEGKNSFNLYDSAMQHELDKRIIIENEMESALFHDEFFMVYQPKTDLDGNIRGLESLLRWNSSLKGFIGPDIFIPIAEDSGFIIPLGYHVFRQVCMQVGIWAKQGVTPLRITVNISPRQFSQADFIIRIQDIISSTRVDPVWIGLEITESGMMENEKDCIEKLNALQALGLTISIDDFGKGYSSMTRLGHYPVDALKIDKSFIDDIPGSQTANCIVQSIIDLAHNLNLQVVAEGCENREQVDYLHQKNCDLFQGYYFYKALKKETLDSILPTAKAAISD
ncbi:MAG: hypothetical protein B6241_13290 [Spirochaetaceae bacterium 4572_59]|nr:MAG: hypothetical protein B6241_13290 [Spirochaetaceae bacterium 4572_59]